MLSTRSRIAAAVLVTLALAACGSASAASHGKGSLVQLRATSLGKVLTNARGFALYLYTPDTGRKSTCYGGCAHAWPPLLTKAKPRAGKGVKAKLLGTTKRKDGKLQVTYAGHPLYRYAGDAKAGQTNGQDVGGIWYVVSAAGKEIDKTTSSASTSPGTTTTPDSGGGY
jgi:predicted lipoprotein with Yx(FWY)xxD motif